ncbi:MAG: hypothetical protein J0L75_13625 [Spirochaetes bacterium]|nr:hypothetical protein [Spirochaetota bacterium]
MEINKGSFARAVLMGLLAASVCLLPLSAKGNKGGGKGDGAASGDGAKVLMGAVGEIDAKAGTLMVDGKTLKVGEKSAFFPASKKEGATLADFKKDDKVTVSYSEKDGELTVITLSIQSAEKGGKKKKKKSE